MDERTYNMFAGNDNPRRPEDEKQLDARVAEWLKKAKANAKKDS